MKYYQKILVVRTDRIGDVVLTTPSLEALRKTFPEAYVAVMVSPVTKEIVEGNPNINEVIVYDRKNKDKGLIGFWKFVFDLRKEKFDLAIVYHTKKRTNLICFLAGIPERVGYHNNKFGFLLTKKITDERPEGKKHEIQYCMDILRSLGIDINEYMGLYMPLPAKFEAWAKQFLLSNGITLNNPFIAIHPGGSDYTKRWPHEKFAKLINLIKEKYPYKIILIGGLETQNISENIKQYVRGDVIDAVGLTSVGQLAALLKESALLISNDSGPVHVACAVGVPVISIFGKRRRGISHIRWMPVGPKCISICKEDDGNWPDKKLESDLKSLEAIDPEEILQAVDKIIG